MRILVVSDSHGFSSRIFEAVERQPEAKALIFLGDGERDIEKVEQAYPRLYVIKVKGNCDFASFLPVNAVDEFDGVRVYCTHGYEEKVKFGRNILRQCAADNKAAIALYGHTHIADTTYDDGIWLVNPGSIASGQYAAVDITPGGIMPVLMKL